MHQFEAIYIGNKSKPTNVESVANCSNQLFSISILSMTAFIYIKAFLKMSIDIQYIKAGLPAPNN
jgi:hypothetical protein